TRPLHENAVPHHRDGVVISTGPRRVTVPPRLESTRARTGVRVPSVPPTSGWDRKYMITNTKPAILVNDETRLSVTVDSMALDTAPYRPAHASDSGPVGWGPPAPKNARAADQPNVSAPSNIDEVVHRGQEAWIRLRDGNTWVDWVDVGKAHVVGRA